MWSGTGSRALDGSKVRHSWGEAVLNRDGGAGGAGGGALAPQFRKNIDLLREESSAPPR